MTWTLPQQSEADVNQEEIDEEPLEPDAETAEPWSIATVFPNRFAEHFWDPADHNYEFRDSEEPIDVEIRYHTKLDSDTHFHVEFRAEVEVIRGDTASVIIIGPHIIHNVSSSSGLAWNLGEWLGGDDESEPSIDEEPLEPDAETVEPNTLYRVMPPSLV